MSSILVEPQYATRAGRPEDAAAPLSPRGTRAASRLSLLACALLAAAFTMIVLQYALHRGKLIVPATYDDVTYLRDGLSKLDGFYRGGFNGLVGRTIDHPPHAPLATLLAFVGFAIFGVHDWAPYAANGVIILVLLLCVRWLTRDLRRWKQGVAMLFVLTVPIAAQSVYEFRPDLAVGLLTAAAVVALLDGLLVQARRGYLLAIGLLIAVALVAKPSWVLVTLGTIGVALLAACVRDRVMLRQEASAAKLARAVATVMVPALLLPAPWYFHNRHEILYYLTENALGKNSHIWRLHAGMWERLQYYGTGYGGQIMLGRHFVLMTLVLVIGALLIFAHGTREQKVRALCYAFVMAVAYIGPTIQGMNTQFLAACFDFLLIFLTLKVLRWAMVRQAFRIPAATALVLLFVLGAWYAKWPLYWGEPTRADVVARNQYMHEIYQHLRGNKVVAQRRILVGVMGSFVNTDALGYMADKDGFHDIEFISDFDNPDAGHFEKLVERSDFVVMGDPQNPEDNPNVAYSRLLSVTLPMMRSRADYELAVTCPAAAGKNYYLFKRRGLIQ